MLSRLPARLKPSFNRARNDQLYRSCTATLVCLRYPPPDRGQHRTSPTIIRHVAFELLGHRTQAAFARYLDSGYDPGAPSQSRRGDEGIAVRNLSVRYGARYAFEGLTGEFLPASLTAVIGPNGAGKSSLLKALAGIVRPATGEIACAALARHRLAYLPQQDELDRGFPITVAELVALGDWRNLGSVREPSPRLAESVFEAIAAVGLTSIADRQIDELSVGQFQRALFARLLLQDADVHLARRAVRLSG